MLLEKCEGSGDHIEEADKGFGPATCRKVLLSVWGLAASFQLRIRGVIAAHLPAFRTSAR